MEVGTNLLDKILGWFYRRFWRWQELRGFYEGAIKQWKGDDRLKQAATKILRSNFFDEFVKKRTVTPDEEFSEFLRRLKESCPNIEEPEILRFLEFVYERLATEMEGHPTWGQRGDAIAEFLKQRKRASEVTEIEAIPITYISHFTSVPIPKNFLDRDGELSMLMEWLENPEQTVGVLVGIGGQGKTYLAAKLVEECSKNGWQVRWMELPKTVDDFLRSVAAEMQSQKDPYHTVVGDPSQTLDVRIDNAIGFLEKGRWLFVLDDFHKVSDYDDWQKFIAQLDQRCRRTKVLLTARREPEFPLKLPTGAHELQDVPPLPKAFAQAYLEDCGLKVTQEEAERIWEKCKGNCEAMKLFAQAARRRSVAKLLDLPLPDWSKNAQEWCEQLLADLGEEELKAGKRLALFDEPVEGDLLLHLGATWEGLDKLVDWRLAELLPDERYTLHDIVRDYWRRHTSKEGKSIMYLKTAQWYISQAHSIFNSQAVGEELMMGIIPVRQIKPIEEWGLDIRLKYFGFVFLAFKYFDAAGALEQLGGEFFTTWHEIALWIAVELQQLGILMAKHGDYGEAERLHWKSLEIEERLGNLAGKAATLHNLGALAHARGNYEEAERLYRESLEIRERLDDLAGKATTLWALGTLRKAQGRKEEARELLQQALEIFERIGDARAEDVKKDLQDL